MAPKTAGRMVGVMPCPNCEHEVEVRVSKKGFLYYSCPKPVDGGCGHQVFNRDRRADGFLAKKITRWRNKEDRKTFLDGELPDSGGDKTDAGDGGKKTSWLDREILK